MNKVFLQEGCCRSSENNLSHGLAFPGAAFSFVVSERYFQALQLKQVSHGKLCTVASVHLCPAAGETGQRPPPLLCVAL